MSQEVLLLVLHKTSGTTVHEFVSAFTLLISTKLVFNLRSVVISTRLPVELEGPTLAVGSSLIQSVHTDNWERGLTSREKVVDSPGWTAATVVLTLPEAVRI